MDRNEVIKKLELELVLPMTRRNPSRITELLADDFSEIGSSGKKYLKHDVIESMVPGSMHNYSLADFCFTELSTDCVLVTYLAVLGETRSRRWSVWGLGSSGWKMRYHQSTPIHRPD